MAEQKKPSGKKSGGGILGTVKWLFVLYMGVYLSMAARSMLPLDMRDFSVARTMREANLWMALTHATWFTTDKSTPWLEAAYEEMAQNTPQNDYWAPPVIVLDARNVTLAEILERSDNLKYPVLVKGFSNGHRLSEFNTFEKAYERFNNDTYPLEILKNSDVIFHSFVDMGLMDAMDRMSKEEDLYLRFNFALAQNNPGFDGALTDVVNRLDSGTDEERGVLSKYLDTNASARHCFMNYGNRMNTPLHTGFIANWFLQVAGRKLWRLLPGAYTPYLKPQKNVNTIAYKSNWPWLSEGAEGLPTRDIVTEPGDLLYFPGYWWHEVSNLDEHKFGLGCGFRPKKDFLGVMGNIFYPQPEAEFWNAVQFIPHMLTEGWKVLVRPAADFNRRQSTWHQREKGWKAEDAQAARTEAASTAD